MGEDIEKHRKKKALQEGARDWNDIVTGKERLRLPEAGRNKEGSSSRTFRDSTDLLSP